jgi:glucose uptake protein
LYQPQTYAIALSFMILSMLCWGSWANTVKLCPGYRFQLFYWDYVVGLIAGALFWGLTLGTAGATGSSFVADLAATDAAHIGFALVGGIILT